MPMPAYMEFEGIEGSCQVTGREGQVEVLGFNHEVYLPTDVKDGTPTGTRKHGRLTLVKNYDKATPDLFKCLCQGKAVPTCTIHWYMINADGEEKEYFQHVLEGVRITRIHPWMPNVDDKGTEQYKHMEEISLSYETIAWKFLEGNIEYKDSWLEGR